MNKKLVLLAGKGTSTNIIYHALKDEFFIQAIILEDAESRIDFLKRRIKKLGAWKVFGQVLFQVMIAPALKSGSSSRKKEIFNEYNLNAADLPGEKLMPVRSVNEKLVVQILQDLEPSLIIVNGTRIISKSILQAVPAKFINIHVGITPKYRGVHGGYWALINKDTMNCGVTIHVVDSGIDTGNIISQQQITITSKDNIFTYPFLQLAAAIPHLRSAIHDLFKGEPVIKKSTGESKLWSHPTLWEYLYYRIVRGIK